jgi:hypothetical protein
MRELIYTVKCLWSYVQGNPAYWGKLCQPVVVVLSILMAALIGHWLTVFVIKRVRLSRPGAGRSSVWIGVFERAVIASMVMAGATAATVFIFASKTAVISYRLGEKGHREFTEYVIVGTLISYFFALAFGFLGIYLLDVLL